jgi:hypothetical protein
MMLMTELAESIEMYIARNAVTGLSPMARRASDDTATATRNARTGAATA